MRIGEIVRVGEKAVTFAASALLMAIAIMPPSHAGEVVAVPRQYLGNWCAAAADNAWAAVLRRPPCEDAEDRVLIDPRMLTIASVKQNEMISSCMITDVLGSLIAGHKIGVYCVVITEGGRKLEKGPPVYYHLIPLSGGSVRMETGLRLDVSPAPPVKRSGGGK
jgi:hypothetical protein